MFPTLDTEVFQRRRAALLHRMPPRSAALFVSLPEAPRNGDVIHPYRPDSDLYYLTGFAEPDCALLLTRDCDAPESAIFLRDRDPKAEVWTGVRTGVAEAPAALGVEAAFPVGALAKELPGLLRRAGQLIYRAAHDTAETAAVRQALAAVRIGPRGPHRGPHTVVDPALTLHELRLRKGPEELERIREANRVTGEALCGVMAEARPGTGEWEIQARLDGAYRAGGGWGWGFPTIVASGANACVLHYQSNAAPCGDDSLVLVDTGAEVDGYGADVSRTFPVGGRFDGAQRDVYAAVLAAPAAASEGVRPGVTLDELHGIAVRSLIGSMLDLGLLSGDPDGLAESGDFKRFYPHQTSHWLGLDVHDVGRYYLDDDRPRPLEEGMVFTVEPGLYVPEGDETVPAHLRGIGVRIEDDVLVTADGYENLSMASPKAVADIEGLRG